MTETFKMKASNLMVLAFMFSIVVMVIAFQYAEIGDLNEVLSTDYNNLYDTVMGAYQAIHDNIVNRND